MTIESHLEAGPRMGSQSVDRLRTFWSVKDTIEAEHPNPMIQEESPL